MNNTSNLLSQNTLEKGLPALSLIAALLASITLAVMAFQAANTRGGELWGVAAVLATVFMHMLPALVSRSKLQVVLVGCAAFALLFVISTVQYSAFFIQREEGAAAARVASVPKPLPATCPTCRNSRQIAADISKATAQARWMRGEGLEKQNRIIAALNAELTTAQTAEAEERRNATATATQITQAASDPLYARAADMFGVGMGNLSLVISIMTAVALELTASLLWFIGLSRPNQKHDELPCQETPYAFKDQAKYEPQNAQDDIPAFLRKASAEPAEPKTTEATNLSPGDLAKFLTWLRQQTQPVSVRHCLRNATPAALRKKEVLLQAVKFLAAHVVFDGEKITAREYL